MKMLSGKRVVDFDEAAILALADAGKDDMTLGIARLFSPALDLDRLRPDYPQAPPRRYYRLTKKGREAPDHQWSNPQLTLYPERGRDYFREKRRERKYIRKSPTKLRSRR